MSKPRHLLAMQYLSAGSGGSGGQANFNTALGVELTEWRPDFARVELEIRPDHQNGAGSVHGGVLMSLLDTVSGFAGIYAETDDEQRGCATIAMNVKFLKPAHAGRLVAEAHSQGGGRNIFFTRAEIRDADGAVVATGDGTFRYRTLSPRPANDAAE